MKDDGTVKTILSLSISAIGAGRSRSAFRHAAAVSRPFTNQGAGQAGPILIRVVPVFPPGTTTYTRPPNGDDRRVSALSSGTSTSTTGARIHFSCAVTRQVVVPIRRRSPSFSIPFGNITVSGSPATANSPVPCQRGTERSSETVRVSRRFDSGIPG